ncbi:hypothetical protein Cgig2_030142 [Carnegiea gigantea]|uniref:Uncharacterized protein n=1 Tax=Carnegiea gigantea TaxID=171969 RepID=A0A9Q1QAJ4_9CARY|nr:hypothetical protein Cgig2_030142 [Carnegiea gigantea]
MDEVILDHGGHAQEFITDFITYAISTCIVGNANGTCQSWAVKHLRNIDEIKKYNWCGYALKCLNDAVVEWKKDKQILHRIAAIPNVFNYYDSCSTWIESNSKEERLKDYSQLQLIGIQTRIIARIEYERIVRLAEADLEIYTQELEKDHPQQGGAGAMSRATTTKVQRCPYCPHCNAQQDGIVHRNDEPLQSTDKAGGDDNVKDCSTPDDPYYCSSEFLEQVDKLESMAIERMEQRTRMGCSPLSFNLGISPEREACATRSGDITHASFQP